MPNYNSKTYDAALNSIARRLKLKNYQHPKSTPLQMPIRFVDNEKQILENDIQGLENLKMRLNSMGGFSQQDRMIFDKRRGLDRTLLYSYQGAYILNKRPPSKDLLEPILIRALINPNKLKQDYDDKIVSVGYEWNFKVGDVFEWLGTNTYWLIYLQDLTELAYFRGNIRKCSYEIKWENEEGKECMTYAAVRGPVETKINFIQKHEISVDEPNYSLNILIPKNEETLKYFKRYSKFYLNNSNVCWRIEATDDVSVPEIIEITAVEYYSNEQEDDNFIVGKLIVDEVDPNRMVDNAAISGETFIKPKKVYDYITVINDDAAEWKVDKKYPIELTLYDDDPKKCSVEWLKGYSGQFELSYGKYSKTIVVEALF